MENPWLSEETMAQETEEIDLDALIERELPVFGSQPLKRFVLGRDGFNETEQRKRSGSFPWQVTLPRHRFSIT